MTLLVDKILELFGNHTPTVSFFGAIFGGEETLILLSILASHGFLNIWYLFLFYYLGILVSDGLWYALGRTKFFNWLVQRRIISKAYFYLDQMLSKATNKSDFQILFFTKFLYGFRLPTIMYLSRERLSIKSFIFHSLITNFIWVLSILLVGWFSGKGISAATNLSENIVLYLLLIGIIMVAFAVLMRVLSALVKKWLMKRQKQ